MKLTFVDKMTYDFLYKISNTSLNKFHDNFVLVTNKRPRKPDCLKT